MQRWRVFLGSLCVLQMMLICRFLWMICSPLHETLIGLWNLSKSRALNHYWQALVQSRKAVTGQKVQRLYQTMAHRKRYYRHMLKRLITSSSLIVRCCKAGLDKQKRKALWLLIQRQIHFRQVKPHLWVCHLPFRQAKPVISRFVIKRPLKRQVIYYLCQVKRPHISRLSLPKR